MPGPINHRHPLMQQPPQHVKNGMLTLWRLLPYWGGQWHYLVAVFLCSAISVAVSIVSPVIIGKAIDGCVASGSSSVPSLLFQYLAALASIYVVGLFAGWAQDFFMTKASQRVVAKLRSQMMSHLLALDVAFFDTHSRGDIMSRFSNDAEMIRDGMGQTLVQTLTTVVSMVAMVVVMLQMSVTLTCITCVGVPVVIVISRFVVSRSHRLFSLQQAACGNLNSVIEESVGGIKTIRSLRSSSIWSDKFASVNAQVRNVGTRAQVNSGILMPLLRLLDNATYMLVAVVGGVMAVHGAVTVGVIQSFLLYTRQFLRPVNMAASQVNALQSALAGAERIFELLDANPDIPAAIPSPSSARVRGDVVFENVSFGYTSSCLALSDVSLHVYPGQVVAIVGGTGAGKTTMVNLLARFYDVSSGRILVDGVDVRDYDVANLRRQMAIVLQEPILFSGSIAYNISYGDVSRPSIPDVEQSARQAMADAFISRLPNSYDERIGSDAALSDGQRQLLTIARAMHSRAPILILDEATSSVDTHTEAMLQRAMANLTDGRTCFIIAHRLSTIRQADLIVVLDHGRIVETGSHDELIARGGAYKSLFDSQFADC